MLEIKKVEFENDRAHMFDRSLISSSKEQPGFDT